MKKMNKSAYIVELCGSRWSPWWWRLRARNGKILAHSEDYTTKRARDKTGPAAGEGARSRSASVESVAVVVELCGRVKV